MIIIRAISSNISKTLTPGALLNCIDNTGAKVLQIIAVYGYKGKRTKKPRAGVASLVSCRVYKGNEKVRHQVFRAVIVRQRKEYRRANGMRVRFEDNAAVIVDDKNDPKGTIIKGAVAKEVVERFSSIGKIASIIV